MKQEETPCQRENRFIVEMIEVYYNNHDDMKESHFKNIKQAASTRANTYR